MTGRPLAVIGNVNVDLILGPVAPWPEPGTEVLADEESLRPGGAAGNASQAWAGLGIAHQIVASTGADMFGNWLREAFGPRAARWPQTPGGTTVSVGVTHPDGERTFLTTPGHLAALDWRSVEAQLDWRALAGGTLLLCGTFLTVALARDYPVLLARARAAGVAVALDTGWPPGGWTAGIRAHVKEWAAGTACLLLNAIEAEAQTGEADPAAAAEALRARMPEGAVAVVKCGARGAVAAGPEGICRVPAPTVRVVDTIGAGDVFNAGFLAARARGAPLSAALAEGTRIASNAISTDPRRYPALRTPPEEAADERA